MEEIRCGECDKLLAKGQVVDLTIKCPRCGTINHVRATSSDQKAAEPHTSEKQCGSTSP